MKINEKWDYSKFKNSKIFHQLQTYTILFENNNNWPSISDYQYVFKQFNLSIKPVPQSQHANCFEDLYESRVFLKNELQTRTNNWHDFFNALIWLKFPKTKKILNSLHYEQSILRQKGSNRSVLENRITQFDECGAIIVSNNENLLNLIRNHQWQELFLNYREQLTQDLECIIFGHAIFEKALNPYIGMTCHCILLNNDQILDDIKQGEFIEIDQILADIWQNDIKTNPIKFDAFPLLGMPEFWENQSTAFYENKNYFR